MLFNTITQDDLEKLTQAMDAIAPGLIKVRTFILDYNQEGIAKHQTIQAIDVNKDLSILPGIILQQFTAMGLNIVGILEVKGDCDFDELKKNIRSSKGPKDEQLITWFVDLPEGMKTIEQDRVLIEQIKQEKGV